MGSILNELRRVQTIVIVSALTCLPVTSWGAKAEKLEEDYWEETSISQQWFYKEVVSRQSCNQNPNAFLGCFAALNDLAAGRTKPAAFAPAQLVKQFPELYGNVIMKFGAFSLYEFPEQKSETPQSEAKKKYRAHREAQEKAVLDAAGSPFAIEFDKMAASLMEDDAFRAPNKINMKLAAAASAFLRYAIDPHAGLKSAEYMRALTSGESEKAFGGLGLELSLGAENTVIITDVFEGTPGEKAGFKAGDQILAIEGIPVTSNLTEVTSRIRGEIGSTVKLSILRQGKPLEIPSKRGAIRVENINSTLVKGPSGSVGYIRVRHFMDETLCDKVDKKTREYERDGAKGIVLDLRNNAGGLLSMGICLTGVFVGGDKVAVKVHSLTNDPRELEVANDDDENSYLEDFGDGRTKMKVYKSVVKQKQSTRLPVVVLINSMSASASEIVAGALRDHQRAWLVGVRSFGKGSVQTGLPSRWDSRVMIFKTTARFYQPGGTTNQLAGIEPDFKVLPDESMTEEPDYTREADIATGVLSAEGEIPKSLRPQQTKSVQACVEQRLGQQKSGLLKKSAKAERDYQLNYVEQVIACQ